jgi:hypothetical protein
LRRGTTDSNDDLRDLTERDDTEEDHASVSCDMRGEEDDLGVNVRDGEPFQIPKKCRLSHSSFLTSEVLLLTSATSTTASGFWVKKNNRLNLDLTFVLLKMPEPLLLALGVLL